jgi:hypothetical protein
MMFSLRLLNDEGLAQFRQWLMEGAPGDVPLNLLKNPETSGVLQKTINVGSALFNDRYEFGVYLNSVLSDLDANAIANDQKFWSSLALLWFDRLCPPRADGTRLVREEYRYILSDDYRHYYRHLVRSPWQLVRLHGANARLLLMAPKENESPLSIHGEILEQFGGRQQVLGSRRIIAVASRMYLDLATGRPKTGVAGSGRGSARRFGLVLRQLDLTHDPEQMPDDDFYEVLPNEFSKWKPKATLGNSASLHTAEQTATAAG